jgi:hypothetical protein
MDQIFKMTPHQIYEYFATARGTGRLDDAQEATRQEWEAEEDRASLIRKQGELIRGGWQGAASEGAFGAAQPLADSALHGAGLLSRAEDLLDRQSGSFHRTANSVKPVPERPPAMDIGDPMFPFTDYEKDVTSYQSDAQHNIDAYRVYDGASEYNETNMPAEYRTTNHSGGTISVASGDTPPGDYIEVPDEGHPQDGDDSGPYGRRRDPGSDPGSEPGGGPPVGNPPFGGPLDAGPDVRQPQQQTSPSDFVPRPPGGPPGPPPSGPPVPTGQTPNTPVPGGYAPVGGFPGGTGGPRGGMYSGGDGPGPTGRGPAGMRGPFGPGAGVGALAAEEAAAQRAAAAAAARGSGSGAVGAAPVGAGRGKGDEDEKHQRKYLIEADAEGVFGSDVLTAPEVIGDDEYEDD